MPLFAMLRNRLRGRDGERRQQLSRIDTLDGVAVFDAGGRERAYVLKLCEDRVPRLRRIRIVRSDGTSILYWMIS
jgi:hypothetical protein